MSAHILHRELCDADFARTLELELVEKDAQITNLEQQRDCASDLLAKAEARMLEKDAQIVTLREALQLFAKLEVPKKPIGNAGMYSIPFERIIKAQSALSTPPPPVVPLEEVKATPIPRLISRRDG